MLRDSSSLGSSFTLKLRFIGSFWFAADSFMRKSEAILTEMSWLNNTAALLDTYSEGSFSFVWLAGLGLCPQEVLMATHVQFQAEVA